MFLTLGTRLDAYEIHEQRCGVNSSSTSATLKKRQQPLGLGACELSRKLGRV
jgi:hypothetical protein